MQVYLSPQISDARSTIKINGEKIQVDEKLYDFTDLPNGTLRMATNDIVSAKRENGKLYIEIINRLDESATQDELFPRCKIVNGSDVFRNDFELINLDWQSDEEKQVDELLKSLKPSQEKLIKAERELETIELLLEMGLI